MSIEIRFKHSLENADFDIDLSLPRNGISALFGRSGAGKTTLINVVSGLLTPDHGKVTIDDKVLFDSEKGINLPVHKRNIGYVFQDSRLFPHYSVKGNLLYGVKKPDRRYFDQIVNLLAISQILDKYPVFLSGGEKQRVAIARALLSKPDVLLMDEPLASLDVPRKREIMPFLENLSNKVNVPILYVSHSLQEIVRLANYLSILDKGAISTSGPLDKVWASSAMRPWQSFSDQSSLFEGKIQHHHERYALTSIALAPNVALWVQKVEAESNTPIRLQVRANDVSIVLDRPERTSIRNVLPATVATIASYHSAGRQSISVGLKLAEGCLLWATITPWALEDLALQEGQAVFAQVKGVSVTQRDMVISY